MFIEKIEGLGKLSLEQYFSGAAKRGKAITGTGQITQTTFSVENARPTYAPTPTAPAPEQQATSIPRPRIAAGIQRQPSFSAQVAAETEPPTSKRPAFVEAFIEAQPETVKMQIRAREEAERKIAAGIKPAAPTRRFFAKPKAAPTPTATARAERLTPGAKEPRTSRILLRRLMYGGQVTPYAIGFTRRQVFAERFVTPSEFEAIRRERKGTAGLGRLSGIGRTKAEKRAARLGWLMAIKNEIQSNLDTGMESVGTNRPKFVFPKAESLPASPSGELDLDAAIDAFFPGLKAGAAAGSMPSGTAPTKIEATIAEPGTAPKPAPGMLSPETLTKYAPLALGLLFGTMYLLKK